MIKRYTLEDSEINPASLVEDEDGDYVLFTEHQDEVRNLRAEVEQLKQKYEELERRYYQTRVQSGDAY